MTSIALKGLTKTFAASDDAPAAVDRSRSRRQGQPSSSRSWAQAAAARPRRCACSRVYLPDSGTIHWTAGALRAGSVVPPDQRGMGMVFQNYAVWPHMTVFENVVFGLSAHPEGGDEEEGRGHARAGEPRRPGAALPTSCPAVSSSASRWRGLVVEPDPAARRAAVQPRRQAARADALRVEELQRRTGITFVYVTHDQAEAMALSDQIVVFHGGRCSSSARRRRSMNGRPTGWSPTSWGWSIWCREKCFAAEDHRGPA